MSICDRYHPTIRRAFNRIRTDYPRVNKKVRLYIATKAVTNKAGSEGITPTLLLFGATPKIALPNLENLQLDQKAIFKAMKAARKEMEAVTAQIRVKEALKHRVSKDYPQFSTLLEYSNYYLASESKIKLPFLTF